MWTPKANDAVVRHATGERHIVTAVYPNENWVGFRDLAGNFYRGTLTWFQAEFRPVVEWATSPPGSKHIGVDLASTDSFTVAQTVDVAATLTAERDKLREELRQTQRACDVHEKRAKQLEHERDEARAVTREHQESAVRFATERDAALAEVTRWKDRAVTAERHLELSKQARRALTGAEKPALQTETYDEP